jgi:hypothetical protein
LCRKYDEKSWREVNRLGTNNKVNQLKIKVYSLEKIKK